MHSQLDTITQTILREMEEDEQLKGKYKLLKTIPGIGPIVDPGMLDKTITQLHAGWQIGLD